MKKLLYTIIGLYLMSASSCGSNSNGGMCSSEKVGEINLATVSKTFILTQSQTGIVFENQNGDAYTFNLDVEHKTTDRICTKYLCEAISDPFQPTPCKYYEAESYRNIYRDVNQQVILETILAVENYEAESLRFYDFFFTHFSAISPYTKGQMLTHKHDPTIDENNIFMIEEEIDQLHQISIHGQIFSNVYVTTDVQNHQILVQPNNGVIAFKLNDDYYLRTDL